MSPILRIVQSSGLTRGCVIRAVPGSTWILTCKHGRTPGDPWQAGPLTGDVTITDPNHDLALLITGKRWTGPVLQLADKEPALPVVFIHDKTLPRPWPFGCPLHLSTHRHTAGESGLPLVIEGRVYGVRWGGLDGASLWVPRGAVERFLKGVQR